MMIRSAVNAVTLPAVHANALSIHSDPLVSQAKNSAAMTSMATMIMDHWHEVLMQDTGCVVLRGSFPLSECFNDSATDVTRIAAPTAFCWGVSEQPASNEKINTAMTRDMTISFVGESVQLPGLDDVTRITERCSG